jgi:hypothetical protein
MRIVAIFLLLIVTAAVEARIGETAIQFVDRYGPPKDTASSKILDKNSPLVEGAIHHVYEYQGWKIRQLSWNGMVRRSGWVTRSSDLL